jgi:hypothetical protein
VSCVTFGVRRQISVSEMSFQMKIRAMDNVQKIYRCIDVFANRVIRVISGPKKDEVCNLAGPHTDKL